MGKINLRHSIHLLRSAHGIRGFSLPWLPALATTTTNASWGTGNGCLRLQPKAYAADNYTGSLDLGHKSVFLSCS